MDADNILHATAQIAATILREVREYRELEAQVDLVYWTEWLTYATFLSVLAAAIAAALVGWSLLHARNVARRQLRAYVMLGGISTHLDHSTRGAVLAFRTEWKNAGNTPALGVRVRSELTFAPADEIKSLEGKTDDSSRLSIGPGFSSVAFTGNIDLSRWDEVFTGAESLHLICRCEYQDIFGHRHFYEHCAKVIPLKRPTMFQLSSTSPADNFCFFEAVGRLCHMD